jgi:hypothetical protein
MLPCWRSWLAADYLPSVWVADQDPQALRRHVSPRWRSVRQRSRLNGPGYWCGES